MSTNTVDSSLKYKITRCSFSTQCNTKDTSRVILLSTLKSCTISNQLPQQCPKKILSQEVKTNLELRPRNLRKDCKRLHWEICKTKTPSCNLTGLSKRHRRNTETLSKNLSLNYMKKIIKTLSWDKLYNFTNYKSWDPNRFQQYQHHNLKITTHSISRISIRWLTYWLIRRWQTISTKCHFSPLKVNIIFWVRNSLLALLMTLTCTQGNKLIANTKIKDRLLIKTKQRLKTTRWLSNRTLCIQIQWTGSLS